MDVLESRDFVLRNGSRVRKKHEWFVRAKDSVSRAIDVCVPGTHTKSASVTAASRVLHIERIQHLRSIVRSRVRGRCRFAVHGSLQRMGARA